MLGSLFLRRLPVPGTVTLAIGAAAESTIVFLMLVCGVASRVNFLLLGAITLALFWRFGRGALRIKDSLSPPADRASLYLAGGVLAVYTALYLINALAPELEPDARGYHLGLTAEYVRLHHFPHRIGFFEMAPQGLEMLFVPAFAFGRHSAARLVNCAFLLATVPLLLSIARRLRLPQFVALAAAALYFCSPIVGISGTSAYTDAGAVFFALAVFYLLLVWRDTGDLRYLVPAGIAAGFCYAIKIPGGLVIILALVFVAASLRHLGIREIALFGGAAVLIVAPWLVRDFIMTGNPVAPLFNKFFPNPYFHPSMEKDLAASLGSFWGVPPWRVPYELAVGGTFSGVIGPVFLALPFGLWALRKAAGRVCWIAAALLALPWFWNTGARFLMPALPFLALALAMALPRPALWACVAVQAIGSWPQVFALYHPQYVWRLERIPWRAALRIQPEQDYLHSLLPAYDLARMVQERTAPGARIFSFVSVATAYTDRQILEYWHSALAENLFSTLRAAVPPSPPLIDVTGHWTPRPLSGLRIRVPENSPLEWFIAEIRLYSGATLVAADPQWQLRAWPNDWDLPLAFDGNPATYWRSWEPIRQGMFVEVDFERPQMLSGAVMTSPTAIYPVPFDFYGLERDGWHLLTDRPDKSPNPLQDLRLAATSAVRHAGFGYILADNRVSDKRSLAADLAAHPAEWGVELAGETDSIMLFHIK